MFLSKDLRKHAGEFLRAFRNNKYEESPAGVLFPESNALAYGVYAHRVRRANGEITPWEVDKNLLPTEGLTYLLSLLGAGSKLPNWYIALYAGAISPTNLWTAAGFASTASEITSGTEGYSESNRVAWVPGTAAAAAINNNSSPASFTIVTASNLTVNGAAMLSVSAKGSTSGTLLSATRFGSTRTFGNTDVFDIKYGIALTSS